MFEASSCCINTPSTSFRSACTCCLTKTAKLSYLLLNIECQVTLAQLYKLASEDVPWSKQWETSNVENFYTFAACMTFGRNIQELHRIGCASLSKKKKTFQLWALQAICSEFGLCDKTQESVKKKRSDSWAFETWLYGLFLFLPKSSCWLTCLRHFL